MILAHFFSVHHVAISVIIAAVVCGMILVRAYGIGEGDQEDEL